MKERIGVVGAGQMGAGIGHVFALAGHGVVLVDVDAAALARGRARIERDMARSVEFGTLSDEAREVALARLETATDLESAAAGCDVVIESVPERLELKLDVFRRLDGCVMADALLATNTSAKSVTEIAAVTASPHRVIGLHFFNPPHRMRLVEIVRGLATDERTVARAQRLCKAAGKDTVVVADVPGFATSRINAMIGNEAFFMLQEGVASADDIDRALKLGLNHPMGPFELGDLVGLDTRLSVLEHLHASLGEKFRPCPLLVKYVKAGRLGRKTGVGVYRYDDDGRRTDG